MSKLVGAALIAVAVAAAVYAVSQDEPLDERLVRGTFQVFSEHVARDEPAQACALLTGRARALWDRATASTCEGTAHQGFVFFRHDRRRARVASAVVRRVRVDGDRAVIQPQDVSSPSILDWAADHPGETILVRRDGRWLIEQLG